LLLGLGTLLGSREPSHRWPAIEPVDTSVTFTNPGAGDRDTPFTVAIRDASGTVLYSLECHNDNYDEESLIDFSGDFQCGLFSHGADSAEETDLNLLASQTRNEESADWFNRARMMAAQLHGDCARYPEYGSIRHFALRKMRITFSFTNVQWAAATSGPKLKQFTFRVTAVVNPSAQTAHAEQVHAPRPPPVCEPIA